MKNTFGIAAVALAFLFVAGISVAQTAKPASPAPTFSKDIAPIFQEKCQNCHRPGNIAPMSLLTYQDARPWAKDIRRRVSQRTMPPWFIDKTVGIQHYEYDASLSDDQIATILKWVDAGAPQGDPKDMPPAKVWNDTGGWELASIYGRQPDMVLTGPEYTAKANYADQWWEGVANVGVTEPRWVMAVEMRPTGTEARKVFHHFGAVLFQDEKNAPQAQFAVSKDDISPESGDFLMEWSVGKNYDMYPRESAKLLMPGAQIRWQYHTHSIDHDVTGHPELAIYLYPKGQTPKYRTYASTMRATMTGGKLDIPPNTIAESEGFHVLRAPARLENFQPHMHLRGKAMEMDAILPDGTTEVLSYVGNFNFSWMINYTYADDAAPVLPKGTVIHMKAWHDNTAANPNNPDPNVWVGDGGRSVDEMCYAWVNVTYISQADYDAWAAAHKKTVHGE